MLKLRFKNKALNAVWLVEPKVSIGRSPSNDLVISSNEVAEHHADILVKHENLTLVNVSGSKLLSVNGKLVEKSARLKLNDEVQLGKITLEIVDPKATVSAEQAVADNAAKREQQTGWALKSNHSALANRVFTIKQETIVGRSNECDITLAAAHLSRRHAKLSVQNGLLFVKDLGSANGTYLNGERITEARIKRGDELRFDTLSFGVIGPVEDMDKTTIRKVDAAPVLPQQTGPKRSATAGRRPAAQAPRAALAARAALNMNETSRAADSMATDVVESSKGKSLWIVSFLLVVAIASAIAYRQGMFDPWLK